MVDDCGCAGLGHPDKPSYLYPLHIAVVLQFIPNQTPRTLLDCIHLLREEYEPLLLRVDDNSKTIQPRIPPKKPLYGCSVTPRFSQSVTINRPRYNVSPTPVAVPAHRTIAALKKSPRYKKVRWQTRRKKPPREHRLREEPGRDGQTTVQAEGYVDDAADEEK